MIHMWNDNKKKKSSAANQVPHDQKCEWKSVYGWKFPAFNSGRNISTYHSHKCLQWETTVKKAIKKTTKKGTITRQRVAQRGYNSMASLKPSLG